MVDGAGSKPMQLPEAQVLSDLYPCSAPPQLVVQVGAVPGPPAQQAAAAQAAAHAPAAAPAAVRQRARVAPQPRLQQRG